MADMTSIEINAKDPQDKSVKTTISYVNPNAQPSVLKLFGQKLTNLTQNIYEGTTRVDKTDMDTAADKKSRNYIVIVVPPSGVTGDRITLVNGSAVDVPLSYISSSNHVITISVAVNVATTTDFPDDDSSRLYTPLPTTTADGTITKQGNRIQLFPTRWQVEWNVSAYTVAQTITGTFTLDANDAYTAWSFNYIVNLVNQ